MNWHGLLYKFNNVSDSCKVTKPDMTTALDKKCIFS